MNQLVDSAHTKSESFSFDPNAALLPNNEVLYRCQSHLIETVRLTRKLGIAILSNKKT